jgi:hypothetical protein
MYFSGLKQPKISTSNQFQLNCMRELILDTLTKGLPGITEVTGAYIVEAAKVALQNQGHSDSIVLEVVGDFSEEFKIRWNPPLPPSIVESWLDERKTAENAAIAIAFLLILQLTSYRNFELSKSGTGIDYWLKSGEPEESLSLVGKDKARLEISGLNKQTTANTIEPRIRMKEKQIAASAATKIPGIIVVVEFGTPKAKIIVR